MKPKPEEVRRGQLSRWKAGPQERTSHYATVYYATVLVEYFADIVRPGVRRELCVQSDDDATDGGRQLTSEVKAAGHGLCCCTFLVVGGKAEVGTWLRSLNARVKAAGPCEVPHVIFGTRRLFTSLPQCHSTFSIQRQSLHERLLHVLFVEVRSKNY